MQAGINNEVSEYNVIFSDCTHKHILDIELV